MNKPQRPKASFLKYQLSHNKQWNLRGAQLATVSLTQNPLISMWEYARRYFTKRENSSVAKNKDKQYDICNKYSFPTILSKAFISI